jgi:hypothetical protein
VLTVVDGTLVTEMDADTFFAIAVLAFCFWIGLKLFNKVEDSDKIQHRHKDNIQMVVIWGSVIGLPVLLALLAMAYAG